MDLGFTEIINPNKDNINPSDQIHRMESIGSKQSDGIEIFHRMKMIG